MKEESSCAVCHQPIPQGRVHYGGVSCYSCRAFFRRNTQREELPVCKGEGECSITYIDRKQCSSCRYDKCIRTGMRPELVLTENDKKQRFKKLLMKKKEEANIMSSQAHTHSGDDSLNKRLTEMPPLQQIEKNQNSSRVFSFPFLVQPPSPVFIPNIYCPKPINSCQDFNVFDTHKTDCSSKDKDFLSKLRLEVKNFVNNNKYEQTISQTNSSSIPNNFLPTSRTFSLPYSLSVTVKPVPLPLPCTPSPTVPSVPAFHNAYSDSIKDINAGKYLKNMEYLSRINTPPALLTIAENNCIDFVDSKPSFHSCPTSMELDYPINYSISPSSPSSSVSSSSPVSCPLSPVSYLPRLSPLYSDQVPVSVISNPSENQEIRHIKIETEDKEQKYTGQNADSNMDSQQENSEGEPNEVKKEHFNENEDLLLNYVHKKFRTHVESIENPLKRKSVILNESSSKKICF